VLIFILESVQQVDNIQYYQRKENLLIESVDSGRKGLEMKANIISLFSLALKTGFFKFVKFEIFYDGIRAIRPIAFANVLFL